MVGWAATSHGELLREKAIIGLIQIRGMVTRRKLHATTGRMEYIRYDILDGEVKEKLWDEAYLPYITDNGKWGDGGQRSIGSYSSQVVTVTFVKDSDLRLGYPEQSVTSDKLVKKNLKTPGYLRLLYA